MSKAIAEWGLKYVVLTSVDRDELEDQGSGALIPDCWALINSIVHDKYGKEVR